MDDWYIASQVSVAGLTNALRDPRLRWAYAERMEDTVLTWRDTLLNGSVALDRWTHVRAFGPALELAWWRSKDRVTARAVVASGGAPPSGIEWQPYPTDDWEPQSQQGVDMLLIGERDPDAPAHEPQWSAARIPRYLEYPGEGSARRMAMVRQAYRRQGAIVAWRLVEVKGVGR